MLELAYSETIRRREAGSLGLKQVQDRMPGVRRSITD